MNIKHIFIISFIIYWQLTTQFLRAQAISNKDKKYATEQNKKIELLLTKLHYARGTDKVNTLNELCWESRIIDNKKGLEYGQEAIRLAEKIKFTQGEANACVNVGYIYVHKAMPELANNYYNRAIKIYNNISNPKKSKIVIARINEGRGLLAYQEMDYNSAINYYNNALKIYKELSTHRDIATCHKIIGKIYEKAGEKDKANRHYYSVLQNTIKTSEKGNVSSFVDFEKFTD